jgi:streptogramin lyase
MQLNPRTGEVKEWNVPVEKPEFPAFGMGIDFDKSGNVWFTTMDQGGVAKLDRKSDKIKLWNISATPGNEKAHVDMLRVSPTDGTIWFKDSQNAKVNRLNPETGHIDNYPCPVPFYGMSMNSKGNAYLPSMAKGAIGEIDAETGKVTVFPTPTPNSGARRGEFDRQGRYWFAEFNVGKIGMFDPSTRKFKEWEIPPMPWSGAYDAVPDKNGEVWSGGMHADYIFRLNPNTGEITRYLLPTLEANVRKVMVDNSTNPVTFWVGENHHAKIAKLETLE